MSPLKPTHTKKPTQRRKSLMTRFVGEETASIAVMFALMAPVMFGLIGLGVEAGMWFKDKRELQTIADAAAISAAVENSFGASSADMTAAANVEGTLNGFNATTDTLDYVGTPETGAYSGDSDYVEVRLTRQLTAILSQIFYSFSPTTQARAVATTVGNKEGCVLALSSTASPALSVVSSSTVELTDCGAVSNSTANAYSVDVCNTCDLTTACVWAAGAVDDGLNSINTTDCLASINDAKPIDDPYTSLTTPSSFGACATGTSVGGSTLTINANTTLSEGRYCEGLSITGGTVTLNPGTYVIDGGNFTMSGGILNGTGVTIILTNSADPVNNTGTLNITNGTIAVSAPTTNDTTGIITGNYLGTVIYQDRNAVPGAGDKNIITAGPSSEFTGTIYTPSYDFDFASGNDSGSAGCTILVANTVSFTGESVIENSCGSYGGNSMLYGASPRLAE